jgi:hypothetical protein
MANITIKNVWSNSINVCGVRLRRYEEKEFTDNEEIQALISSGLIKSV